MSLLSQPARHHLRPRVPRDAFTPQPYSNEAKWSPDLISCPLSCCLPLFYIIRRGTASQKPRRCVEKWSRPRMLNLKRGTGLSGGSEMTFDLAWPWGHEMAFHSHWCGDTQANYLQCVAAKALNGITAVMRPDCMLLLLPVSHCYCLQAYLLKKLMG